LAHFKGVELVLVRSNADGLVREWFLGDMFLILPEDLPETQKSSEWTGMNEL
jgi:hypothetical protein